MISRSTLACLVCLLAIAYAGLSGCRPADDTEPVYNGPVTEDHHEHRNTYAGAVAEMETMRNTIRDAFAQGDLHTAHDVLHDVGHVLASIPEHAQREAMDQAEVEAIRDDTEELRELFGQVDAHIHGQEGATYDEVSDEIDAALERLRERATNQT